MWHRSPRPEHP